MKGKELLERIFFGELIPLPPKITDGMAEKSPNFSKRGGITYD
jgi:hypothetical protein